MEAAGNAPKSLVSDLLTEMDDGKQAFPEQAVKRVALTVFIGGYFCFLLCYRMLSLHTSIGAFDTVGPPCYTMT
jgi:hypothetical protein